MIFPGFGRRQSSLAFSLIEVLVASVVLALLVTVLSQVVSMTSQGIRMNVSRIDEDGQARQVFDRLANDLASSIRRTDLCKLFASPAGNDSIQFYAEVGGYGGTRPVSLICYRIPKLGEANAYRLERGACATDWTSANPVLFQYGFPNTTALKAIRDDEYDVLANGVFRMEFCYILDTGIMSKSCEEDFSDVKGIVLAIGALDGDSRRLLSGEQLDRLVAELPDCDGTVDPLSIWNTAITRAGFGGGLPASIVKKVRLYQRIFYVR